MESHGYRDRASGTRNRIGKSCDLTKAQPCNRTRYADRADRLASGIEYGGADAAGSRHRFLIVERIALTLDFLKLPAKLDHVHYGLLR
jgi:hypothetical protein